MGKKAYSILLLLCLVLGLLSGCGSGKGSGGVDPVTLGKTMAEGVKDLPEMETITAKDDRGQELFPYLSDLDYGKVEDYYFSYAKAGTAQEIAAIRLRSAGDAQEAKASLERHVQQRLGVFRVYDPSQAALAENAKILVSGNMVALVMCQDPAPAEAAFRSALSGT